LFKMDSIKKKKQENFSCFQKNFQLI